VDKSLVIAEQAAATGETRYRLLETIRQYAVEKLAESGEATSLRDQHLNFFLDLVEKSEPHTYASDSALWHSRLTLDFENIRAAMDWAASSGQSKAALPMDDLLRNGIAVWKMLFPARKAGHEPPLERKL
jgi:predicted ATPase